MLSPFSVILFFVLYSLFFVQKCESDIVCLANSWKASRGGQIEYMKNTSYLIKTTNPLNYLKTSILQLCSLLTIDGFAVGLKLIEGIF